MNIVDYYMKKCKLDVPNNTDEIPMSEIMKN